MNVQELIDRLETIEDKAVEVLAEGGCCGGKCASVVTEVVVQAQGEDWTGRAPACVMLEVKY